MTDWLEARTSEVELTKSTPASGANFFKLLMRFVGHLTQLAQEVWMSYQKAFLIGDGRAANARPLDDPDVS